MGLLNAEWFHADAFGLDVEKSDKLIGFRCHVCRKSTPPVCPQVSTKRRRDIRNELSGEATNAVSQCEGLQNDTRNELSEGATHNGLHSSEVDQNVVQNEHSEEATNIRHPSEINSLQDLLANEDNQVSFPVDEPFHRKEQYSDHSFAPGSRFEVSNGQLPDYVKENTGETQISNKKLNSELISCNGNHTPKENTIEPEQDAIVTSFDKLQTSSCNDDVDVIQTEVAPSGCEPPS